MPAPRSRLSNPARPLLVLAVILVILVAVAALTRTYSPRLGLDLRGGTTLTLQARAVGSDQSVTTTSLDQAVSIIRNRVNASGVSEATVTRQGSDQISVSAPGTTQQKLRALVGSTAELNFRQVLGFAAVQAAPTFALTDTPTVTLPFAPSQTPSPPDTPTVGLPFAPEATATPTPTPSGTASPAASASSTAGSGASAGPAPSTSTTAGAGASSTPSTAAGTARAKPTPTASESVGAVLARSISPTVPAAEIAAFNAFTCTKLKVPVVSTRNGYLITCNQAPYTDKYLLGPAFIVGTDVSSATAALATSSSGASTGGWEINVTLKGGAPTQILSEATAKLLNLSQETSTTAGQGSSNFAIVLDGIVYSDPYVQAQIPDGQAQISGNFTGTAAKNLANVLKYGALPLTLDVLQAQTTSATLGAQALHWGLIAGALGLLLVVGYCLLYYRGLAIVVMSSLAVAGALTYLLVILLGRQIGYTLSLAGIAGLIVAVGITADSFVVFFERLRDEVREGRSLRSAVESGWIRARRTIIAADFVSFLAAAVLYVLSIADVRGFAFTLGLTTLIDIVVVFLFTKPLMTLLARTEFFGRGHRLSGLDARHLGRTDPGPATGPGSAGAADAAARARARARASRPDPSPES